MGISMLAVPEDIKSSDTLLRVSEITCHIIGMLITIDNSNHKFWITTFDKATTQNITRPVIFFFFKVIDLTTTPKQEVSSPNPSGSTCTSIRFIRQTTIVITRVFLFDCDSIEHIPTGQRRFRNVVEPSCSVPQRRAIIQLYYFSVSILRSPSYPTEDLSFANIVSTSIAYDE